MHRLVSPIVAVLGILLGASVARASDDDAEASRMQGLREYDAGHYTAAARHFRSAAESGDARSAEILCLMHRFGATLYDGQVPASPEESARWAAFAAQRRTADSGARIPGDR